MENTIPHALSLGTIRSGEYDEFLRFVDAAFGRPAGRGLRQDFPTALGPGNVGHLYVGRIESEIVCAAAAWVRTWRTSVGPLRTACLGSFSTPVAYRGRGYSAALQQYMLRTLAEEGVDWAVLWTDRPEVYRGRGFAAAGTEWHGRLEDVAWPVPGGRVRDAVAADVPAMLELYAQHPFGSEREAEDFLAHMHPGISRVRVLEEDGRVRAYAAAGKGADFEGYVHDYAGDVEAVHALWGAARRDGAQFVLVPDGAQAYLEGAAVAMLRRAQSAALVRALAPERFPVPPAEVHWAAWGFDSA